MYQPKADTKSDWFEKALIGLGMIFPTVMAWLYFGQPGAGHAENSANPLQQAASSIGKSVQFGLPLFWLWRGTLNAAEMRRNKSLGWFVVVGFGIATALLILIGYFGHFRSTELLHGAAARLRVKLGQFGINSTGTFLSLAIFITVVHSLLEEVYWHLVYIWRAAEMDEIPAGGRSLGLAFMSHHVVIAHVYFPDNFWSVTVPISLGIAVGGGFWAWGYRRTGHLCPVWASHGVVDAALMIIGYDLMFNVR